MGASAWKDCNLCVTGHIHWSHTGERLQLLLHFSAWAHFLCARSFLNARSALTSKGITHNVWYHFTLAPGRFYYTAEQERDAHGYRTHLWNHSLALLWRRKISIKLYFEGQEVCRHFHRARRRDRLLTPLDSLTHSRTLMQSRRGQIGISYKSPAVTLSLWVSSSFHAPSWCIAANA
jgi:hypothetical protein